MNNTHPKYLLFPHGGSGNHGCEAIVRTTKKMINSDDVILFSSHIDEDKKYLGNDFIDVRNERICASRFSPGYLKAFAAFHAGNKFAYDELCFSPVIKQLNRGSTLLSIGGDNYCYGEPEFIYLVNRAAKRRGCRTVLWGCSVEPHDISEKMKEDLASYDLIVARESITFEALKKINDNVVLHPDPAFTLPVGDGIFPDGLREREYVGINISPMVQGKEKVKCVTLENYRTLIKYIIEHTNCNIALIPHVVWGENSNDLTPLTKLYNEFKSSGRVFLVKDQNCTQLKDVISKSKIFVGARTHATIAAYSTCVPTLVVGYSVKARGIAKDIFGSEANYVIPVQSFSENTDLLNAFKWIESNCSQIKTHLKKFMPGYISRSYSARELLK